MTRYLFNKKTKPTIKLILAENSASHIRRKSDSEKLILSESRLKYHRIALSS